MFSLILLPLFLGWQLQGGVRQDIQTTERTRVIQPATIEIQGNQGDGDNLQPAMGYNVLN